MNIDTIIAESQATRLLWDEQFQFGFILIVGFFAVMGLLALVPWIRDHIKERRGKE